MAASQPGSFNLQEFSDVGQLLVGGRLYTYAYGTTAQKIAYTDSEGVVPHTYTADGAGGQYIALNARGELPAPLYLGDGSYDIALKRADGSTVWTRKADGIDNAAKTGIAALSTTLAASDGSSRVGFALLDGGASVKRSMQEKARELAASPYDLGAVGDGIANDTVKTLAVANARAAVTFPAGTFRMSQFPAVAGREYKGQGLPTISLFNAGDSAMVKLQSNSHYEGLVFRSTEADLNSQRVAIDDKQNVSARRCEAYDFRNPSSSNAWGVLIQRSSNIYLDNWRFGNNTQSDIALTDACRDITIIHPVNTVDGGVTLNVEPNTDDGVVGMNVVGGHYKLMYMLENQNTAYASRNIVVSGARIDKLVYDGSGVRFENCQIGSIVQEGESLSTVFAGPLMIDTCDLGQNLLTDPYMFDVSPSDATCFWTAYSSSTYPVKRYNDPTYGKFTRINDARANQQVIVTTRPFIPCANNESFILFIRSRCDNTGTGTNIVDHVVLQWFDGASVLLKETTVKTNRCPVNTLSDWCNDIAVVRAPANAASFKFRVTNNYTGTSVSCIDTQAVGMFRYSLLPRIGGDGNMPNVLAELAKPNTTRVFYQDQVPAGANNYGGGLVGERIVRKTPVVGQPKAWVCTAVQAAPGDPGTWVSEGVL